MIPKDFYHKSAKYTFDNKALDVLVRRSQKHIGAVWMEKAIGRVRKAYGLENWPILEPHKSYICVSNHRSLFDLYAVTSYLVHRNLLPHRMMFPVRSEFFYDHPVGFLVNGACSFFAMYPPVYREKKDPKLHQETLDEITRRLQGGGVFLGIHPEGKRSTLASPYELLPAKYGLGKIVYDTQVTVLPVFVNGLQGKFTHQIKANVSKKHPVNMVFGKPVSFEGMIDEEPSHELYKKIAQHALDAVYALGQKEKLIREGEALTPKRLPLQG